MNPVYKFSVNGHVVNPLYKQDISKEYTIEPGQQFFRTTLSGNLRFLGVDFEWLSAQNIEIAFNLYVEISYDGGASSVPYWQGIFYKTDGKWDYDDKIVEVKVAPKDQYTEILANIENEYNLLELSPARHELTLDKRPVIQVYVLGESTVSCFLGGTRWSQDVEEVVTLPSDMAQWNFSPLQEIDETGLDGTGEPPSGELAVSGGYTKVVNNLWDSVNGAYRLKLYYDYGALMPNGSYLTTSRYELTRKSDGTILFCVEGLRSTSAIVLQAITATGASGSLTFSDKRTSNIFSRYLLDTEEFLGVDTYAIKKNDMAGNPRNYNRVIGYAFTNAIVETSLTVSEPTEFGLAPNGEYYQPPYSFYGDKFYPIGQSFWEDTSLWFRFDNLDWILEESGRVSYTIREAIKVSDAIKVLLRKIGPTISHEPTSEYSSILNGVNPLMYAGNMHVMLTQKTNIMAGSYDEAAKRAPTTLASIFDMLEKTMQLHWYVDQDSRLIIEHISWFKKGGSYASESVVGSDITALINPRNGRSWAFASNKLEYDKVDMPERFEFSWMDKCSDAFEGHPIEVRSKFVQRGKIESVSVSNFTSDIDYLLLNPSSVSPDGFALFGAVEYDGGYRLPYIEMRVDGADLRIQNGYVGFTYLLPVYWTYDLPSRRVNINGENFDPARVGIQRKLKQSVTFPALYDPDPMKLIKTDYGQGQIEKISVSLHSRIAKVDLRYDTEPNEQP